MEQLPPLLKSTKEDLAVDAAWAMRNLFMGQPEPEVKRPG